MGFDSPILFCPHLFWDSPPTEAIQGRVEGTVPIYDFENRLTSVTGPGLTATYAYDGFGRRVKQTVNGVVTYFLHDGDQVIEEWGSGGVLQATYTYGSGIDENLTMNRGGQTYYYFHDGLGSVTDLTKATGELVESYQYDAYGQPTTPSTVGNPYLFTGREYDQETGLYHYRARAYHPGIGRFIQRDPLSYLPDTNLYRYVYNNAINWVDPWGLDKNKPWWQKLEEGYYYGTSYGQEAAEWYAQQQIKTGNPWWGVPGAISSLWTPETYQDTAWTLITGRGVGGYLGRPYYQYYPAGNERYVSRYLTRGRGWKPPFNVGSEAAEKLSLPPHNPGTAVRRVIPNPFRYTKGPSRIDPKFGHPGGGTEYILR